MLGYYVLNSNFEVSSGWPTWHHTLMIANGMHLCLVSSSSILHSKSSSDFKNTYFWYQFVRLFVIGCNANWLSIGKLVLLYMCLCSNLIVYLYGSEIRITAVHCTYERWIHHANVYKTDQTIISSLLMSSHSEKSFFVLVWNEMGWKLPGNGSTHIKLLLRI